MKLYVYKGDLHAVYNTYSIIGDSKEELWNLIPIKCLLIIMKNIGESNKH